MMRCAALTLLPPDRPRNPFFFFSPAAGCCWSLQVRRLNSGQQRQVVSPAERSLTLKFTITDTRSPLNCSSSAAAAAAARSVSI